jgi:hypothetical protein
MVMLAVVLTLPLVAGCWRIRNDALAHGLAADSSADLYIRLFEDHAAFELPTACTAIFSGQEPLHVRVGQLVNGNDALALL